MEIRAYSLVQAQVCVKPLSVFVASPAGNGVPVAGSYHLISNGPDRTPCSRTVFGESGLPFTRATITTSDCPPPNQWWSPLATRSTAMLNGEVAESAGNILAVMECAMKRFTLHTAVAAAASAGSDQTISTEVPLAASIAAKDCEAATDVSSATLSGSSFRMRGLFSACSAIQVASWRQALDSE